MPVDVEACNKRHESEEELGVARMKIVSDQAEASVKAVESRIKIWVLMSAFTLLAFIAGALVVTLVKVGAYQEKIERIEVRQEKFEIQQEKLQETLDGIKWGITHDGRPPWQARPEP